MADEKLLAVVRVRSNPRTSEANNFTLKLLKVPTPNSAALVKNTPEKIAMIRKVASMLTWGEVSDESLTLLRKKAGDAKAVAFHY